MGISLLHKISVKPNCSLPQMQGKLFVCTTPTALGIATMQSVNLAHSSGLQPFATLGDDTRFYDLDGLEPWKISVENSIRP
jgi:hypothetical protein